MKKSYIVLLTLLVFLPFSVMAAEAPKVLTVTAESEDSIINFKGTTEEGVYAAMCKLYNTEDEEIDMLSVPVDAKEFEGSFTNVAEGTYNVACARYEGGEVKKVEVVVEHVAEQTTNNPKTYDAGIIESVIVLSVCVAGIIGSTIYLKKKKVNKN